MLLEIGVADAYGCGFEYNDQAIKDHNNLNTYIQHPRHLGIKPGMFSDDTQMSVAVAEAILSGEPWTPLMLANKFVECFKRDFRDGYARRFQKFLESVNSGEEFLDKIIPESERSGSAMRAGPIGIIDNIERVIEMATIQAEVTHKTRKGVDAAVAAALFSYFCWNTEEDKKFLPEFLESRVKGYNWGQPWRGKVGVEGIICVHAAITAFMETDNLSDMIKYCVNFSGDVDTVAAIAMAGASGSKHMTKNLPENLILMLENGKYGRDYLVELDRKLMSLTTAQRRL